MTVVDTRNLEWKDNNVGSKLLQKMGWKDGQGIGKRRLLKSESNMSSEGLRVKRRAEGLGLGATTQQAAQQSISHAADFADVLKSLQEKHASTGSSSSSKNKSEKKKSSKKSLVMPTNKSTHAKVRQAKFQEKTADDMKCIFAGADIFAELSAQAGSAQAGSAMKDKKKRKRENDPEKKAAKKKEKKEKK